MNDATFTACRKLPIEKFPKSRNHLKQSKLNTWRLPKYFAVSMLLLFQLSFFSLSAQDFQFGLSAGLAHYQGDLTPKPAWLPVAIGELGPSAGFFGRWTHKQRMALRIGLQFGQISASDAQSNSPERILRNLSFQTNLFELSVIEEINLFEFGGRFGKRFTPYGFLGVAGFYFNPKAEYQGQLYALQPLGTEGQGMPGFPQRYALTQLAIPMGGGLKFLIGQHSTLSLEMGGRKLFTDYLDDVGGNYVDLDVLAAGNGTLAAALSNRTGEITGKEPTTQPGTARGGPHKDWYFFSTISFSWDLQGNGLNSKMLGCPGF